jgi:hypothetical protein
MGKTTSKPPSPGQGDITNQDKRQVSRTILLHNLDVNDTKMKPEHVKWLDDVVALAKANPKTSIRLRGTASKSGDPNHNRDPLSRGRAEAVAMYLVRERQVSTKQIVITWSGSDTSTSASKEDERDRGVEVQVSAPLTVEKVSLWRDNWIKELTWDDIIGMDSPGASANGMRFPGMPINNVNIQVEASGAPRSMMPEALDVYLNSRVPNRLSPTNGTGMTSMSYPSPTRSVPFSTGGQPADTARTWYRLSIPLDKVGDFLNEGLGKFGNVPEVAFVVRDKGTSDKHFRDALGWAFRGRAVQTDASNNGSERDENPDAIRLLQAGGVEVLEVTVKGEPDWQMIRPSVARLVRSPADVFYYSGHGLKKEGCLALHCDCHTDTSVDGYSCWTTPEDIARYWPKVLDVDVLILASCSVLNLGGAAPRWANLLTSRGGPLYAVLGYRDAALSDEHGGNEIAARMAKRIAAGLKQDEWCRAWLEVNDEVNRKNGAAVGMDNQGYWMLGLGFGSSPRITGPLPIPKS